MKKQTCKTAKSIKLLITTEYFLVQSYCAKSKPYPLSNRKLSSRGAF